MKGYVSRILVTALTPLLFACSSGDSEPTGSTDLNPPCTLVSVTGLVVRVSDRMTGEPILGATGTVVRADGYTETATAPSSNYLPFAQEGARPVEGIYDVTVTRTGYKEWSTADVELKRLGCNVQPVELEAKMVPL